MDNKLLIIDDDKEICEELKEMLEDEGYSVEIALDGEKGLQMIKSNNFNIILQDIKLPGINGVDLLKRTKLINEKIKVIILTGRPMMSKLLNEDKEYEKEENEIFKFADAVFNKPFDIFEVIEKIKKFSCT